MQRVAMKSFAPAVRSARGLSTSAMRLAAEAPEKPAADLPRGTVVPGEKVDPQLGDYPAMPMKNQQFRPYSSQWWDKQDRRNFGETVREMANNSSMSRTMSCRCGRRTPTRPRDRWLCATSPLLPLRSPRSRTWYTM